MNNQMNNQINNQLDSKESKYLKEDVKGGMYIKDVNELEVKSVEEALDLLNRAQKRRVVASTDLNAESSRSHSIFTIRGCTNSLVKSKSNSHNINNTNKCM